MKKWNDVYRMVKNGDLDASLLKTGCENLKAARERATHVMEGFKESFGATEDTMVALCSAAWAYRNLWKSYRSSAWTSAGRSSESGFSGMCRIKRNECCAFSVRRLANDKC